MGWGGGASEAQSRPKDPGCRPPATETLALGYLALSPIVLSSPSLPLPPTPLPLSRLRLRAVDDGGFQTNKMESPMSENKINARRKAVVLNGFPLLALSFQTLGMLPLLQPPGLHQYQSHAMFRHYLLRYWHSQHCHLLTRLQVPLIS